MDLPDTKLAPWQRTMWPLLQVNACTPLSATVKVEIAAQCHAGKVKPYNEDNYLVLHLGRNQDVITSSLSDAELPGAFEEHAYFMAVADGIGGAGTGAVASRLALSAIAQLALKFGKWNVRVDAQVAGEIKSNAKWLAARVQEIVTNHSLTDRGLSTMAAAITSAYSAGDDLFIAHIGHCRGYIFREGNLIPLTKDDTLAAEGYSGPSGFEHFTDDLHHILTHAIGGSFDAPKVEIKHFHLVHGDCLVLCTNGLTDLVEDFRIADVLMGRRRLEDQCRALIDLALDAGGTDNVSIILAQYTIPQP